MKKKQNNGQKKKKNPSKKFSVLAVATGDGLSALFTDMGADRIIAGGQTANPSIEEFIEAFESCDTEHIIVLPNNKNIMMVSEQAAKVAEGREAQDSLHIHELNV